MNLLAYLAAVGLLVHLALGVTAILLDRRSALNRAYAIICLIDVVWAFFQIFVYASPNEHVVQLAYRLSAIGWAFFPPALFNLAFVLSGIPSRRAVRRTLLGATAAFSLVILAVALLDGSFLQPVRLTPVGNLELPAKSIWYLLYLAVAYCSFMALLGLILFSRRRSSSRRYRKLTMTIFVTYLAALLVTAFMIFLVPPIWDNLVLVTTLSDSATLYVIVRFRFMRPDLSLVEQEIFKAMEEAVIVVDPELRVLKSNPAAEALLSARADRTSPAEGLACFDDMDAIRSEWQRATREKTNRVVKDAWVEGMSVQVTLIPCYDRYKDLIGGTLIARRNNLFDSAAVRFGITTREKQIAIKLMLGYSNPEIAERFSIAPSTVKSHVHSIYQKTGAANRVELVRRFLESDNPPL